jgi:hypothetical protein
MKIDHNAEKAPPASRLTKSMLALQNMPHRMRRTVPDALICALGRVCHMPQQAAATVPRCVILHD